jgi:hypothetical protein
VGARTSVETNADARRACELCGERARVDILEGYVGDVSVRRHLCLRCARTQLGPAFVAPPARKHLGRPFFLALAGAGLAVLGVCGDLLARGSHPGFGWYQGSGVAVGVLLLLAGSFFRAEILALAGAGAVVGALLADVLGGPGAAGIGWKQQVLIGVGAACVACAVLGRLVPALRAARSRAKPSGGTECGPVSKAPKGDFPMTSLQTTVPGSD